MSSPPDSPLSSIGSDDGRSTPQPDADPRSAHLSTPSHSHRRTSDASHDDPLHPSKRRKIATEEPPEDDWEIASLVSEDSFTSAPGSPSTGEYALRSEAVTACQWEGCTAGDLGNSDGLIQHVQTEHVGAKRAKYTCDWGDCARKGMNHPSGYALKAHMRSHTKEKPFFCALPECDRSFTRSDALAKHMRTVHEPEPPKASLTNANPIDPATGQPKKGPKLRLLNGTKSANTPALTADKNPLNAGLTPEDPEWDPSPPNDNIRYTPAHHPVTGQPGFLINYPPDIHFSNYESEIPADQLMRLLRRQLVWAKREGEELEREVEELERVKREEWVMKEAVLEGVMEAELRMGERRGAVREKMKAGLERDLRLDKVRWNREPEWRKRNGWEGIPADTPYGKQEVDLEGERLKREKQANRIVDGDKADDMMAVGALMGLSGAS
ncbi:C2H2 type zinc finger domain-containing protein 16 [Elsinoe australis]|uniref:C2H2 type zinc finger domain-containing protein 16 n=1 Tax=Elsinoe australis TaxID=40998 RepID=A0A4U7BH15_9PEZI|nr:C2H2 type zinc finger domain-containing protein 16 [Elsinoe australis]